jgi:tetratricopeptide (TPR) repeat protein
LVNAGVEGASELYRIDTNWANIHASGAPSITNEPSSLISGNRDAVTYEGDEAMQETELIKQLDDAFEKRASGSYSEALDSFESLERMSENSKDISALRLFQTYCLMDMGRVDDALDRISGVHDSDLEIQLRANYEYQIARMFYALGRVQDAIPHGEQACQIFDSLGEEVVDNLIAANAEILLGLLLAESKRCNEAFPLLQKVSIHDPAWGHAKLLAGDCFMEAKRYDEAIECYLAITSSDLKIDMSVKTDALRNIGCSYYWLGEYGKSISYLMKVKDSYEAYPELKETVLRFLSSASSRLYAADNETRQNGSPNATSFHQ